MSDLASDLDLIRDAAEAAGRLAMAEREAGLKIWSKSGGSPVTSADMAVDRMLREALLSARPDHGWLSEETEDNTDRLSKSRIFVVDPIDGTVAYMKGKPWWCIPIAIVEDGRPIAASDTTDLDDASVLADARLMEGPHWPEPWPAMRFEKRNALAYRMALVAAGAFDAAINLTPKCDWDVCAGALIVEEAGGRVSDHQGHAWRFNQADPRQNSLVCSAPALHPLIVRRTAPIPLAPR
jgi:myo-inositol-1(or 4)-monophosphatase